MKDKDKDKEKDKEKPAKMKRKTLDKKLREFRRSPKPKDPEIAESGDADEESAQSEETESVPAAATDGKAAKSRRAPKSGVETPQKNGDDPSKPPTRLGLIRARHESMRREIDQIREDLESDEEE